ncbi:MAG: hypothetical protein CL897_05330 [Dehalococcoidia bacterium]|nr:hypothetical protein [Dehalococcoidia bacterium]HCV00484.1 hypothetical protein [Dehalococcoidia bacterium]|tara:strand:+ start:1134 stop:1814 length:681 start_codon:yes stop_codon:yes gene_type:complete
MREAVTGVILVGGLSRRFGSDKASAVLRGRPLLQWVRDALAPAVDELLIVTARDQALPPMHPSIPVTVVEDHEPECGPLGGLTTGFLVATTPICFVACCDAPLLQTGVVQRIVNALGNHDAVVPEVDGFQQPLTAAYRREPCLVAAQASLGAGVKKVLDAFEGLDILGLGQNHLVRADSDLRSFRNSNTLQELESLATLIDSPRSSHSASLRGKRGRSRTKSRRRH